MKHLAATCHRILEIFTGVGMKAYGEYEKIIES